MFYIAIAYTVMVCMFMAYIVMAYIVIYRYRPVAPIITVESSSLFFDKPLVAPFMSFSPTFNHEVRAITI